ncbi:pentapeptide repeat-containing protein [Dysgonomonas sp. 216]|uniref:pentapeptide repeat-containing protein n=1 Tax=Dysgonomonas sp. 216 TaxID=2302934 RepID=UPI0013CF4459|nr:pentapeptide repeat-containing protein [Dysgonomonas sp. 216]NDW17321.1 pentapeptide repeat-containing protein [Dysgonomonas sp. 216]
MVEIYYEDECFESRTFEVKEVSGAVFDNCTFKKCDLSEMKLFGTRFVDCSFVDCNLAMITLNEVQLANAEFDNCKILGVDFSLCSTFLFSVKFNKSVVDYSLLKGLKISGTSFIDCSLKYTDFADADLSKSQFIRSNLEGAMFENTNLREVDFTTAYGYSIDLDRNVMKKARFSLQGVMGLLGKYDIRIE